MSDDGPLCPDCLLTRERCECPRCRTCDELEDYCRCDIPSAEDTLDFDDDSDDLTDKEHQWE